MADLTYDLEIIRIEKVEDTFEVIGSLGYTSCIHLSCM
jgi:hypothetical protein